MCGIAGLVGLRDAVAATGRVHRMTEALRRRGPDGEGVIAMNGGAVLGHRRLAIFDLSPAGAQPMLTPDRELGITFNGAIFNFLDLRGELEAAGFRFHSRTDTEVLLHGYQHWGIDGLVRRLRGMYAFGLWDAAVETLFLVRDRLGVKPLAYVEGSGTLAFASTPGALRAGGFAQEIDPHAVAEFLEFGFVTDQAGIYEGVHKVPPASILEWKAGQARTRSYWELPEARPEGGISFDEAVERTERLFLEAVRLRLDADVPVAALLSAGVDSSLVCWAVAKLGADITAFTVATPGHALDEGGAARATAQALGLKHRVIEIEEPDESILDELTAAYSEPFACASAMGLLRVSHAVKNAATVLLTGDGGDDVFLGYPEHRHFWMAERLARALPPPAAWAWRAMRGAIPAWGILRRGRHFADYATGGLGAVTNAHPGWAEYVRDGVLGPRLRPQTVAQREIAWSQTSARRLLAEFLAYDRQTRFTGEYLPKVDGATMHWALEARSPFLDQELWTFAASLPFALRMRQGGLKAVLRELARRHVGEAVAEGRKRGFHIPVADWLRGKWRRRFEDAMADPVAGREGWIDAAAVRARFAREAQQGRISDSLWYVFVWENWLRQQQRPDPAAAMNHQGKEVHG